VSDDVVIPARYMLFEESLAILGVDTPAMYVSQLTDPDEEY